MEVTQFVMQYNAKTRDKNLTENEQIDIIEHMSRPKSYISLSKKKEIVKSIIKNTIKQDDDLNINYDGCDKYLLTVIRLINEYTDLNIDEKGYDQICANGLLNLVIGSFGKEYEIIMGIMNLYMEQLTLKQIDIRGW